MPHFFPSNLIQGLTSSQRVFPNISHTSPRGANRCISMHLFLTVVKGNKSKKELILSATSKHIVQNYFFGTSCGLLCLKIMPWQVQTHGQSSSPLLEPRCPHSNLIQVGVVFRYPFLLGWYDILGQHGCTPLGMFMDMFNNCNPAILIVKCCCK